MEGIGWAQEAQVNTLSLITITELWTGGVPQVVEHLPSKCEALSSDPTTAKKTS
jgi:hypothetical protein